MTQPAANLLRFGDVLGWTGLSEWTLGEIITTGQLGGAALWPGGRRFFLREVCRHVLFAAPLPSLPFGTEPEPELLRVCDVLAWTGLTEKQFRRIERHGLGGGRPFIRANAKRHYPKAAIRAHLFTPLLPTSWASTARIQLPTLNPQSLNSSC